MLGFASSLGWVWCYADWTIACWEDALVFLFGAERLQGWKWSSFASSFKEECSRWHCSSRCVGLYDPCKCSQHLLWAQVANYPLVPEEEPPQDCSFDFPGHLWIEHWQTPFFFFFFFFFFFCVISWSHLTTTGALWYWSAEVFRFANQAWKIARDPWLDQRSDTCPSLWHGMVSVALWSFATESLVNTFSEVRNGWSSSIAPTRSMQTCALVFSGCEAPNFQCKSTKQLEPRQCSYQHWSHVVWAWKFVEIHPMVILKVFCKRWSQFTSSHMIPTLSCFVISSLRTNIKKEVSWIKNFYLPLVPLKKTKPHPCHIKLCQDCQVFLG